MRTLSEIIDAAKSGGRPDYDELRYAVCALDGLMTFDRQALSKLAEAEREGKKPFLVWSAQWQHNESFTRVKRALGETPKAWLGPNHDPDSPEVQERRRLSQAIFDKAQRRAAERQQSVGGPDAE